MRGVLGPTILGFPGPVLQILKLNIWMMLKSIFVSGFMMN